MTVFVLLVGINTKCHSTSFSSYVVVFVHRSMDFKLNYCVDIYCDNSILYLSVSIRWSNSHFKPP